MPQTQPRRLVSTKYSKERYAHPFYLPSPQSARQPINGQTRMTDWSKLQLGLIPPIKNNGTMTLDDLVGADGVKEIEQVGEIRFHALGDSGVGQATEAENVAEEMATDFKPGAGGLNPAFLFHLGDVIYGPDKAAHYADRFYRPYRHYPGKAIAIPGNHDGEEKSSVDSPSLKDFLANFCASKAVVPPQAAGSGIYRETMTQPGVYWMLDAPFVRIIGLYSNRLENPGYLEGISGGKEDSSQIDWLNKTLATISRRRRIRPVGFRCRKNDCARSKPRRLKPAPLNQCEGVNASARRHFRGAECESVRRELKDEPGLVRFHTASPRASGTRRAQIFRTAR